MMHISSPHSLQLPAPQSLKATSPVSDCASDSTTSDHRRHKTPLRHLKVKITRRTRLFKLNTTAPRNQLRLIQSIESMLQQQAPVTSHPAVYTAMPLEQKRCLLGQLRNRVVVIEDTINKASAALQLLIKFL